ncbi:MAG: PKD domain-containing protein [Bacteroidia bacterium]|nr:PKD domain-containing protein [Bacteroidia bacterium]
MLRNRLSVTLFFILCVWGQQPQPWNLWGIYQDSTGTGVGPVEGQVRCPGIYWIVVDTSGMGARDIESWRLYEASSSFYPMTTIVFDDRGEIPSGAPFPPEGLADRRKVGVEVNLSWVGQDPTFMLCVYYANGDSAIVGKRFGFPQIRIEVDDPPYSQNRLFCPGSTVSFRLAVSSDIDSFKVGYGPSSGDTVRNQTTFRLTVPARHPWQLQVFSYACGQMYDDTYFLQTDPSEIPVQSLPSIWPQHLCLGDSVGIGSSWDYSFRGFSADSVTILNQQLAVIGGLRLDGAERFWRPTAEGVYYLVYNLKYPCSSWLSGDTTEVRVYGGSLRIPPIRISSSYSPSAGSCPGTPVSLRAEGVGYIRWDLNYDGNWDTVGYEISATFAGAPPHQLRIEQDLGCVKRIDTLLWEPEQRDERPLFSLLLSPLPLCPSDSLQIYISPYANFSLEQPNALIEITASWLNAGQPFRLWSRLDTLLPSPANLSSHFLSVTLVNGCLASETTTYPLYNLAIPPQGSYTLLGAACRNDSVLFQIIPNLYSNEGEVEAIRYILPNGTVIEPLNPGDTVSFLSPPAQVRYLTVEKIYSCFRQFVVLPLPTLRTLPNLRSFSPFLWEETCANSTVSFYLSGRAARKLQIVIGDSIVYEGIPEVSYYGGRDVEYFDMYGSFRVPRISGQVRLLAIAEGCGGVRDTLEWGSVQVRPLPKLSGLSLSISGNVLSYSVNVDAADTNQVVWDFGDGNVVTGVLSGTHTYSQGGEYTVRVYAYNSCGEDSLSQQVSVPTTLKGAREGEGWSLFPNPAHGEVSISAAFPVENIQVTIFDGAGRRVSLYTIERLPARLSLSLPAGLYMLQVQAAGYLPAHLKLLIVE